MKKTRNLFTSEAVSIGHPDHVCDMISDSILDSCLKEDKNARVACETVAGKGEILITGEITSKAENVDIEQIVRIAIKEIGYDNIKYFKGNKSVYQTLISTVDLSSPVSDIKVEAYLINTKNVYVSENSIYFLKDKYDYTQDVPPISSILGLKGIFGAFEYESDDDETSDYVTEIYKFDIDKNAGVVHF